MKGKRRSVRRHVLPQIMLILQKLTDSVRHPAVMVNPLLVTGSLYHRGCHRSGQRRIPSLVMLILADMRSVSRVSNSRIIFRTINVVSKALLLFRPVPLACLDPLALRKAVETVGCIL